MENKDKILEWLNGDLTPEELADLKKTEDYRQLKDIVEQSSRFDAPHFDEEINYRALKDKLASQKSGPKESFDKSLFYKIAAVFIIVFATGLFLVMNDQEEISTGISEITFLELPDSSTVTLNTNSRISYIPEKWEDKRSLRLTGEAFFKVEKGSDFTVETGNGKVKVVGTEFTVRSRNNQLEVWCYEGAVKISYRQKEFLLKEDQTFLGTRDSISGITASSREIPVWAVQESSFEAVALRKVIQELEEQFEVEIIVKNVDLDQLFTGSFSHSNMEIALKAVTVPLQLKFEKIAEKKILLYEE